MFVAHFNVPELQPSVDLEDRVYLWFAYFWADITTLASPQKIATYVPPGPFTRDGYPSSVQDGITIWIPPAGNFSVNVDDGGSGTALVGALVLLFEQHDTSDEAIAAGYDAFGPALSDQLNAYVNANGPVPPTDDQLSAITDAVHAAVKAAVRAKLHFWELLEPQDDARGDSHVAFFGSDAVTVGRRDLGLPAIGDFTFPNASYDLELFHPDMCVAQEQALAQAIAALNLVKADVKDLQKQLAQGTLAEKAAARAELAEIRKNELPAAQKAATQAQQALTQCRVQTNSITAPNVPNVPIAVTR